MEALQVLESTYLVPLPTGTTLMVGAPPEALKLMVLWEYPSPSAVVLPPDPLFANGLNQASFEFLLFNYLFVRGGLASGVPFVIVCDPDQEERVRSLARHTLRGPTDAEMSAWRTPASHRRQLLREMDVVSGPVAGVPLEQVVRVVPLRDGRARLDEGTLLEVSGPGEIRINSGSECLVVPRRPHPRTPLPFYFADVDNPVAGPRFGLQVIGSASGFSGSEWSSCFLIWINGLPLVVDGTPHLDDHLRRLGIEDDHILGYLITHNHEDHANMIGQLVNRRPVTVLTSGPVMASLVSRLAAILDCPEAEARQLMRWVPLHPGLDRYGKPLEWFGAEIRTWYSVHTIPTLGVEVSMEGKRIRLPGDTLWGAQLTPLREQGIISRARCEFIQSTYRGADVVVADAGGGPIHPDPHEVRKLVGAGCDCHLLVTHVLEEARPYLPSAEPGTSLALLPRSERTPAEATGLFGSPLFRGTPERWLLALLYGGEVVHPGEEPIPMDGFAWVVLAGALMLQSGEENVFPLQRGDLFHASLIPDVPDPRIVSTARWTRLLRIPKPLYRSFISEGGLEKKLERLYRTRRWWSRITGEELGLDTIVALSNLCRERSFRPGAAIVRQGEPASHFYIVTEGEVEVERENGETRVFGRFGSGYHFGELALLCEQARTATVRAVAPTRVLELPARAFRRVLLEIPVARYRIHSEADARRRAIGRRAAG